MDAKDYGHVVMSHCHECSRDALYKAFDDGPPDWLSKDQDGTLVVTVDQPYQLWCEKNVFPQPCFLMTSEENGAGEEVMRLCRKHFLQIAAAMW